MNLVFIYSVVGGRYRGYREEFDLDYFGKSYSRGVIELVRSTCEFL